MKTFASFILACLVLLCVGWVTVVPSSSSSGGASVAAGNNVTTTTNNGVVTVNATVPVTGVAAGANITASTNNGVVTFSSTASSVPVIATITDGSNISWDGSGSTNLYRITVTGNHLLQMPSNPVEGKDYDFEFYQDATKGHYVSFATGFTPTKETTFATVSGFYTNAFPVNTNSLVTNTVGVLSGSAKFKYSGGLMVLKSAATY